MGCTQSKIENEEAVTRCKDRKHHMKDAVTARNAFAAAHSAYAMSLKNTGAALSDFAPGESHHSHHTPPIDDVSQPPLETLFPPPPLPTFDTTSPAPSLSRASTMPEYAKREALSAADAAPIIEEDEDEEEHETSLSRSRGRNNKIKIPTEQDPLDEDGPHPPPSPPRRVPAPTASVSPSPPFPPPMPRSDHDSSWDYFFSVENMPGPTLGEAEEDREMDGKVFDERSKRSEEPTIPEKPRAQAPVEVEVEPEPTPPPPEAAMAVAAPKPAPAKRVKLVMKGGLSVNLVGIFNDLDDHFLKASVSAQEVSKMLEANRLHYHSNFADNRGHIDHSTIVMRVITWNRSFRGTLNLDDGKDGYDSEENETHATVLDKLLAWEKKLYDEVKAGELMKIEYQKKVALLNKQKKRGTHSEALEKAKAAVSHLHTRYIVDMQSLDSTVTEINRLRDHQLYPKLVALVDGMATMWDEMRGHHEQQTKIASALRALDISQAPKETSEHHHERTIQLWAVVQEWHVQFEQLVNHQKEYIKALNSWLRLNLVPIESNLKEKVSSPPRPQKPPIQSLLQAWHDYLEKLPDVGAKSAIFNFAAVVQTIVQHQEEEIKLKLICEDSKRELSRKTRQFEEWYHKHLQRRMQSDNTEAGADDASQDEEVVDRRVAVEAVKKRLEEEEAAYQKQCIHVRDKSLVSLRSRLPELFHAMSEYAEACSEVYGNLRAISQSQNA